MMFLVELSPQDRIPQSPGAGDGSEDYPQLEQRHVFKCLLLQIGSIAFIRFSSTMSKAPPKVLLLAGNALHDGLRQHYLHGWPSVTQASGET